MVRDYIMCKVVNNFSKTYSCRELVENVYPLSTVCENYQIIFPLRLRDKQTHIQTERYLYAQDGHISKLR